MKLTDLENRIEKEFAALRSDSAAKFRIIFPALIAVLILSVVLFGESVSLYRLVIVVLWLRFWVGTKSTLD